jgi:hypothetical protein
MTYSLKQAGEATGRTKPTILRAIQTGKISAKKNEMGEWEIEPAELHRVYPPVAEGVTRTDTPEDMEVTVELLLLRQELGAKDERLAFLQDKRERERRQLTERIAELQGQLVQSEQERRDKDRQLTALLTDQQERREDAKDEAPPDAVQEPRRRFLGFFSLSRKRRR